MPDMEFNTTDQPHEAIPVPPIGDGWMLGGSASTPMRVFHYWQRPVNTSAARSCKKCNAVAFTSNGKCVGCRTQHEDDG